jgi:hypothetical protein
VREPRVGAARAPALDRWRIRLEAYHTHAFLAALIRLAHNSWWLRAEARFFVVINADRFLFPFSFLLFFPFLFLLTFSFYFFLNFLVFFFFFVNPLSGEKWALGEASDEAHSETVRALRELRLSCDA